MENLPQELIFRDVRKITQHIENREHIQVLAQNGVSFDAGSQIVIRIPSNEGESVDFNTFMIHADLQITGLDNAWTDAVVGRLYDETPDTATAAPLPLAFCHDSIESLIRRVHVLVNGSELELIDFYDQLESVHNNWSNSNFCNTFGSGGMLMNLDVLDRARVLLPSGYNPSTNGNATSPASVVIPLRFLALSNLSEILPTYLMGSGQSSIEIRIFLNQAVDCVKAGTLARSVASQAYNTWTARAGISYKLSDVRCNYDVVRTSQAYQDALSQYLLESSISLPFMTYYNNIYNIPSGHQGWHNYTISTQYSDVYAVYLAFFNAAEASSSTFCGNDRIFVPPGLSEARVMVNGKSNPNVPIKIRSGYNGEALAYLVKALRLTNTLETVGMADGSRVETGTTFVAFTTAAPASGTARNYSSVSGNGLYYGQNRAAQTGVTDLVINQYTNWTSPSKFCLGFPMDKSPYSGDDSLSGADLSKNSGLIQIQLKFDSAVAAPFTSGWNVLAMVQHKRILDVSQNNAQIVY